MTKPREDSQNIFAIIPARGGSKGVPQKNLSYFCGRPLISRAISLATETKIFSQIIVNTDDSEIANLARLQNCNIFERTLSSASDEATIDDVIIQMGSFLEKNKADVCVTIQPTAPLLSPDSIRLAYRMFVEKSMDTVLSVVEDTHLFWEEDVNGRPVPCYSERKNRQHMPVKYKETGGFVIFRTSNIRLYGSRFGQKIDLHPVTSAESIDIDTTHDFAAAEAIQKSKKICFRVIGNEQCGLGHFYNSLDLIKRLAKHSIDISVPLGSAAVSRAFREKNFHCSEFSEDEFIEHVVSHNPDLVILDCLNNDSAFIQNLKNIGPKVVTFEDMGDKDNVADLRINAIYESQKSSPNTKSGYEYFILREEFQKFKEVKKTGAENEQKKRMCVLFGGVDTNNLTKRLLDLLANDEFEHLEVEVILGRGYDRKRIPTLKKASHVTVVERCADVARRIWLSDFVFSSAGRTVFEVMALNKPCIVICQNKRETEHIFCSHEKIVHLGLHSEVNEEQLRRSIKRMDHFVSVESNFLYPETEYIWDGGERVVNLIEEVLFNE